MATATQTQIPDDYTAAPPLSPSLFSSFKLSPARSLLLGSPTLHRETMPIDPNCVAFLAGDPNYNGNGDEFSQKMVCTLPWKLPGPRSAFRLVRHCIFPRTGTQRGLTASQIEDCKHILAWMRQSPSSPILAPFRVPNEPNVGRIRRPSRAEQPKTQGLGEPKTAVCTGYIREPPAAEDSGTRGANNEEEKTSPQKAESTCTSRRTPSLCDSFSQKL